MRSTDPRFIAFFCAWLRQFFTVDERRLRVYLYLHEGLDLDEAIDFWASLTAIPRDQFGKPYRAVPNEGVRNSKHMLGCATVTYTCSRTYRAILGLVHALLGGPGVLRWERGTLDAILRERLPG